VTRTDESILLFRNVLKLQTLPEMEAFDY